MTHVPQFEYLNTDLDIISPGDPAPLIGRLFAAGVRPLLPAQDPDGSWWVTFNTDVMYRDPETNIVALLDGLDSLRGAAQDCWWACVRREFNVGYDCGDEPWAFQQGLSHRTLQRMAGRGAAFRVTLYPQRPGAGSTTETRS